ncbi:hypothetical protein ANAEL_00410 [Anaerolineales bacterium]|nr:hypothetical protein ANAEL_00410 [Anaerolineales bacterium]
MAEIQSPKKSHYVLPPKGALVATLIMGMVITAIDVLQPAEPILSMVAFIPGIVSVASLLASGLSFADLNIRFGRSSLPGFLALVATTALLLPILGSSTGWAGWNWLSGLVFAPASGIAQELYFRGSLLPALERALHGKKGTALLLHALIFVGYHFRTFRAASSSPIIILIAVVLFAAGCGWGWQVQKDRTVAWAMGQHSLFLMLMSMFNWG